MQQLTLTRPDDWHIHLRDGDYLNTTVPHAARQFGRAIVMPNLRPPVTTTAQAQDYRQRILAATPRGARFEPLMTLYLTDNTPPEEIRRAKDSGIVQGVKLYPAGATTNSDAGVTALERCYPALAAMEEVGLPLLVHGEVTAAHIDIFDRERIFIEQNLLPLTTRFSALKVVFEHITTRDAVSFVFDASANIAATITAHHLLLNRNDLLAGGIRPHYYCLPVLKREDDRAALLRAATSGNPKFFLGTDSAPHSRATKEAACGCAGTYTAHAALEFYAETFQQVGALEKLEGFASFHGADFYGLPRNQEQVTLIKQEQEIPDSYVFGGETVVPLRAGGKIVWRLQDAG
ncbi:MAG: dihydroorotase [Pseudomonadota bacterium]